MPTPSLRAPRRKDRGSRLAQVLPPRYLPTSASTDLTVSRRMLAVVAEQVILAFRKLAVATRMSEHAPHPTQDNVYFRGTLVLDDLSHRPVLERPQRSDSEE